jgi:hypothetical protein
MAGLSVNQIIEFSVLFLADEDTPRLGELPERMRALSGGWFAPCTDVVAGRVQALADAGFVELAGPDTAGPRRTVRSTDAGLDYARGLTRKVAPQPCLGLLVWRGLQMSLKGQLTANARSALILDLADRDAVLPSMAALAGDFAAVQDGTRSRRDAR